MPMISSSGGPDPAALVVELDLPDARRRGIDVILYAGSRRPSIGRDGRQNLGASETGSASWSQLTRRAPAGSAVSRAARRPRPGRRRARRAAAPAARGRVLARAAAAPPRVTSSDVAGRRRRCVCARVTVVKSSRRTLMAIVRPLRACAARLAHSSLGHRAQRLAQRGGIADVARRTSARATRRRPCARRRPRRRVRSARACRARARGSGRSARRAPRSGAAPTARERRQPQLGQPRRGLRPDARHQARREPARSARMPARA